MTLVSYMNYGTMYKQIKGYMSLASHMELQNYVHTNQRLYPPSESHVFTEQYTYKSKAICP